MRLRIVKISAVFTLMIVVVGLFSCLRADNNVKMASKSDSGVEDFPAYSKNYVTAKMKLPAFNSINSDNCSDIEFIQTTGETYLRAEGHIDDPLRYLDIKVNNGVLYISRRNIEGSVIHKNGGQRLIDTYIKLKIGAPKLSDINMSGTADFNCSSLKQTGDFKAVMRGTGDVDITSLSVSALYVTLNGTGDFVSNSVIANTGNLSLNGTGDIIVAHFSSSNLYATLSGTGDIKLSSVTVTNLSAVASGTGDLKLAGSCKDSAQLTVSGTGDMDARNLNANNVVAVATGTGSLECTAINSISATRTWGSLTYYGSPKKVNITGKVSHK